MSSPVTHQDNCTLVVTAALESEKELVLEYTFQNKGSHDVYIFNRLYKEILAGPVFDTDENLVNIEVVARGVLISKKIVPVPAEIDVEKPHLACATLVKRGGVARETIHLPLPLSAWTPYSGEPARKQAPIQRQKAWFELGYFIAGIGSQLLAQPIQTKQGGAFFFDPFPIQGQKTMEVELPLELPIQEVIRR